jgi:hypothetical protein
MAGAYEERLSYFPKDLDKDKSKATEQDYFTIPILNLQAGKPYAFNFQWVFPDGTRSKWSDGYLVTTASYATKLTKPTVTVTPSSLGYIVSFTKQTDKNFEHAIIEESVSNSNTAPTTGWTEVAVTSTNPTTVTVGDILKRWVRIKLIDKISGNTAYSDPVSVTPVDPVAAALDVTPPTGASGISAVWSGNNILITATVSTDAKKFIISLTNGTTVGFFTKFPTASGTSQTILLTEQELYNTLGAYFTSFTGLFVSTDSLDNRDSGVSFSVPAKANELLGVVPTFTLTPISNGYSVNYTLPTGAAYAKIYASSTSGFTPNDSTNLVYAGASPGIIIDAVYTVKYVKIKYFKTDGATSSISAEQSVTPADPGMLSLINNEVKISTSGSILAGDSATSGGRGIFNKTGIYFYDTGGNATSQLMANASNGSPTFITTNAKIANWNISSTKIENSLIPEVITQYSGLSPSGTYAFWAGSTTAGGDVAANFSVTPAGAVIARNITIAGGSLSVGNTTIAASTGKLTATDADLSGKVTASSGKIGNINIDSGGLYISSATTPSPTEGNRIIFSGGGIAAYASGSSTPKFQLASDGTAKIGGWTVNDSSLSSDGMSFDSLDKTITFKQGYEIDQETVSIPTITTTTGASSTDEEDDTPNSVYASAAAASNSTTTSTISIKATAGVTTGGALTLSQNPISALLRAGSSYISATNTGVVLNSATAGAYVFKNLVASDRRHLNYYGNESSAMLMIKSDGTVSVGRTIFKSGSTETAITTGVPFQSVGLIGDIILSTRD